MMSCQRHTMHIKRLMIKLLNKALHVDQKQILLPCNKLQIASKYQQVTTFIPSYYVSLFLPCKISVQCTYSQQPLSAFTATFIGCNLTNYTSSQFFLDNAGFISKLFIGKNYRGNEARACPFFLLNFSIRQITDVNNHRHILIRVQLSMSSSVMLQAAVTSLQKCLGNKPRLFLG